MANEIIKPHKFKKAKKQIQKLARKVPSNVNFTPFPTEGAIFPWNDHNITGKEVNENLVTPLQRTIIDLYSNIRSLYVIPDEIYKALDSLDKEYIEAIKISVKAARTASVQALEASNKAKIASDEALKASKEARDASKGVEIAQTDIRRTIDALQATVKKLKEFKKSIENDVERHKWNLSELHEQVDTLVAKVDEATKRITVDITALQQYRSELEKYAHLGDIDSIWNDVEEHKRNLSGLNQQQEETCTAIVNLSDKISLGEQTYKKRDISVDKKLKIAYGIAGGSIALTVIQLALQLLGIL